MFYLLSFIEKLAPLTIALALLIGTGISYIAGVRIGKYQKTKRPDAKAEGVGPLEGALLGLLALILSFTLSMAASRFDARRASIIQESNNIGTAILLADAYPDSIRKEFRKDFKQYVETRIAYHEVGDDEAKINHSLTDANIISGRIWQRAAAFSRQSATTVPHSLMMPALNNMIDITTTRDAARIARVPESILWLLIILCLLGSLIIGYSKKEKRNDWIVLSIYSLMTVVTIFTIIDLDRSRQGLIQTNQANQRMIGLRTMFTSNE